MPYCHECGKEIQRGLKFCPECGAQQSTTGGSSVQPKSVATSKPEGSAILRTTSISLIGFGLVLLILGGAFLITPTGTAAVFGLTLLIFLGGGFIVAISGYGLLKRTTWSRLAGNLAGIALLLVGLLLALTSSLFLEALGGLGILLGVASLVVLRLKKHRSYFSS